MEILAYFEEWSRCPGDLVRLAISTTKPDVHATFERILSGPGPSGESRVETEARSDILDTVVPGRWQDTAVGSYGIFRLSSEPVNRAKAISIHCWIWPSSPAIKTKQTIWALDNGLSLSIENTHLALSCNNRIICSTANTLSARQWHSVLIMVDSATSTIDVLKPHGLVNNRHERVSGGGVSVSTPARVTLATDSLTDRKHLRIATTERSTTLGSTSAGCPTQTLIGYVLVTRDRQILVGTSQRILVPT